MHRRVVQTVAAAWKWNGETEGERDYEGGSRSAVASNGAGQRLSSHHDRDYSLHVQTTFDAPAPPILASQPNTTSEQPRERPSWRRMSSPGGRSFASLSSLDDGDGRLRTSPESIRASPESMRRSSASLGRVVEENDAYPDDEVHNADVRPNEDDENEDYEWELQERGFYNGQIPLSFFIYLLLSSYAQMHVIRSYSRFITLYTFVPLTALLTFIVLVVLPLLFWPASADPHPHTRYFPSPLPEFLLSSSLFALSHLLRLPLYTLSSILLSPFHSTTASTVLSTTLSVILSTLLRLSALALLNVRHAMDYPYPTWKDPAFGRVWWLSLNVAEVVIAIVQGYEQVALYRDVMVPDGREKEFLEGLRNAEGLNGNGNGRVIGYGRKPVVGQVFDEPLDAADAHANADGAPGGYDVEGGDANGRSGQARGADNRAWALSSQIDHDFDQLLALKAREELEEVYGVPVIVRHSSLPSKSSSKLDIDYLLFILNNRKYRYSYPVSNAQLHHLSSDSPSLSASTTLLPSPFTAHSP
ncbi:hypothetical protein SERLADRAFT_442291, partial [Serpula lacrymans var. lacrymans S7.9]